MLVLVLVRCPKQRKDARQGEARLARLLVNERINKALANVLHLRAEVREGLQQTVRRHGGEGQLQQQMRSWLTVRHR